jgi:hypothetical protein
MNRYERLTPIMLFEHPNICIVMGKMQLTWTFLAMPIRQSPPIDTVCDFYPANNLCNALGLGKPGLVIFNSICQVQNYSAITSLGFGSNFSYTHVWRSPLPIGLGNQIVTEETPFS